jgi:pimeloyl-ACP methyl ester carboxylesterase
VSRGVKSPAVPRTVTRTAPAARLSDEPLPPLDTGSDRWPGHSVPIAGTELYVRVSPGPPDAAPALCVHGLGGSSTDWTDLAGQLSGRLAVESIDLPGFGRSGPAMRGDYSLRGQAATVISYLEHSARGPVHLIGNSMGGAIVLIVAAQRPDLVRTLSVISPAVPDVRRLRVYPLKSDARMAALVVPVLGPLVMKQAGKVPLRDRVKATIALCFADPSRYSEQRLAQAVEDAQARVSMAWATPAFLRATRDLARTQLLYMARTWRQISTITVPTLVLWGDADKLVAPDLAPFVAEAIPGARLLVLDGVGHTAMMEVPVATARAVLALVEDAAGAA